MKMLARPHCAKTFRTFVCGGDGEDARACVAEEEKAPGRCAENRPQENSEWQPHGRGSVDGEVGSMAGGGEGGYFFSVRANDLKDINSVQSHAGMAREITSSKGDVLFD